jgi:hypothetical protein
MLDEPVPLFLARRALRHAGVRLGPMCDVGGGEWGFDASPIGEWTPRAFDRLEAAGLPFVVNAYHLERAGGWLADRLAASGWLRGYWAFGRPDALPGSARVRRLNLRAADGHSAVEALPSLRVLRWESYGAQEADLRWLAEVRHLERVEVRLKLPSLAGLKSPAEAANVVRLELDGVRDGWEGAAGVPEPARVGPRRLRRRGRGAGSVSARGERSGGAAIAIRRGCRRGGRATALTRLALRWCRGRPQADPALAGLAGLRELETESLFVGAAGAMLGHFQKLERYSCHSEDGEDLAALPTGSLRTLQVAGHTVRGLPSLPDAPALEALDLRNTSIADDGLDVLARCPALKHLALGSAVRGSGLRHLADPARLLSLGFPHVGWAAHDLTRLRVFIELDLLGAAEIVSDRDGLPVPQSRATRLNLFDVAMTPDPLPELAAALPALAEVEPPPTGLSTANLRKFRDAGLLPKLSAFAGPRLDLSSTRIDAEGFGIITPHVGRIEELGLSATPFGDGDLPLLTAMPSLKRLTLSRTKLKPAGIAALAGLPRLGRIELAANELGDEVFSALVRAGLMGKTAFAVVDAKGRVTELDLTGSKVTDAALPSLARLKHLEALDLRKTQVTGGALAALAGLKHLRKVMVPGRQAKAARAALPECEVG